MPGKTDRFQTREACQEELQWGPGRMPGKTK